MSPPYAILHRLSVEDGHGNTPHILCAEAPCTEYETRQYSMQSICPFHAIVRLGMHLDTPHKIERTFDRLYEIFILRDAVHWHLLLPTHCAIYYGPLLWHTPHRPYETGDLRLEIGLLMAEQRQAVASKRALKRRVRQRLHRV